MTRVGSQRHSKYIYIYIYKHGLANVKCSFVLQFVHLSERNVCVCRIWSERRALRRVVSVCKSVLVRCDCETQLSAVSFRC
jgi:hypothetical protein